MTDLSIQPNDSPSPSALRGARLCRNLGCLSLIFGPLTAVPSLLIGVRILCKSDRTDSGQLRRALVFQGFFWSSLGTIFAGSLELLGYQQWCDHDNKSQSIGHLESIGKAITDFEKTEGSLPIAIYDSRRSPLLSWRVMLLPMIGETDLYREFHLNEAWDSPHNIKLLASMPDVYRSPRYQTASDRQHGLTYYQGFGGPSAAFQTARWPPITLTEIRNLHGQNGRHIVLVAEAGSPIPWTKPEDIAFPGKMPNLGGPRGSSACALFADGHVGILNSNLNKNTLDALVSLEPYIPTQP